MRNIRTTVVAVKEASNDSSSDGRSCGRQQQRWRKLRMAAAAMEKAAGDDVVPRGNFRCVYWWQRKLRSSPSLVEGAAYKSSNDEGNCAWKLDLWMCSLAIKEALNRCVNSGGSMYAWHRVGLWVRVVWGEGCIGLVKLFILVGSIGPNKILFNKTRLSILVRLICFNQALTRGVWHLGWHWGGL